MDVSIVPAAGGYLRVEIRGRESAAQGREAGEAVIAAMRAHGRARVLVVVRDSRPLFKVEEFGLSTLLSEVTPLAGLRVALVADTPELHASHEYVALLAHQRGAAVRAFRSERAALAWLLA